MGKHIDAFLKKYNKVKRTKDYKEYIIKQYPEFKFNLEEVVVLQDHSNKPHCNFFYRGKKYMEKKALLDSYTPVMNRPELVESETAMGKRQFGDKVETLQDFYDLLEAQYNKHFVQFMAEYKEYDFFMPKLLEETEDFYIFEFLEGYQSITMEMIEADKSIVQGMKDLLIQYHAKVKEISPYEEFYSNDLNVGNWMYNEETKDIKYVDISRLIFNKHEYFCTAHIDEFKVQNLLLFSEDGFQEDNEDTEALLRYKFQFLDKCKVRVYE